MRRISKKSNVVAIASLCFAAATLALMTTGSALAADNHSKTIKNSTDVDVVVFVGVADGTPEKEGKRVGPFKIKAGTTAKVAYGDAQNPYVHELLIELSESKAKAENSQYRWVTSPGDRPSWDNTLNANSVLTIEAVGKFDVLGSNGAAVPSGSKRIVNKTTTDLEVVLMPREGPSTKLIIIKKGTTQVVPYAQASKPYLDGLMVNWFDKALKAGNRQLRSVTAKGAAPTWDATLNTNNTLTITGVSAMKVTGSNSAVTGGDEPAAVTGCMILMPEHASNRQYYHAGWWKDPEGTSWAAALKRMDAWHQYCAGDIEMRYPGGGSARWKGGKRLIISVPK